MCGVVSYEWSNDTYAGQERRCRAAVWSGGGGERNTQEASSGIHASLQLHTHTLQLHYFSLLK